MSFTPDTPSTEEALAAILESPLPKLPPQEQRYGKTKVSWWETDPGEVYIHAEGGSGDDRHYASTLVSIQLEGHGYRRAQFDLDDIHPDSRRISSWPDLMAKAKRLIQSGQVHVLRNGYNYIMGHVIGDHGEYDTEISRDDPSSRSISGWQCSCPWDQYAWQRTRKWKKFEGRPCAHTMALYWKALSTPLDEQLSEEQAAQMGTGQKIGPGAGTPMDQGGIHHPDLPRSFGPEGPIQGDQQKLPMNLPPDAIGGPPGPAQAPLAPPPQPPGILPQFPGEQMEMQWAGPGTTPGGQQSPPGAVSVPGAKPPSTPFNPLQGPGTYSKMTANGEASEIPTSAELAPYRDTQECYLSAEGVAHQWPHLRQNAGFYVHPTRGPGDHSWNVAPDGTIVDTTSGQHPGPEIIPSTHPHYQRYIGYDHPHIGQIIRDLPYCSTCLKDKKPGELCPTPDCHDWLRQSKTAADFNPPEIVRLKNPVYGLAEGPEKGQYGDGEYREAQPTKLDGSPVHGEVLYQDPSTGWVEIIVPLDDSGPHEPYHLRCFVEPSDIEASSASSAFIRRKH